MVIQNLRCRRQRRNRLCGHFDPSPTPRGAMACHCTRAHRARGTPRTPSADCSGGACRPLVAARRAGAALPPAVDDPERPGARRERPAVSTTVRRRSATPDAGSGRRDPNGRPRRRRRRARRGYWTGPDAAAGSRRAASLRELRCGEPRYGQAAGHERSRRPCRHRARGGRDRPVLDNTSGSRCGCAGVAWRTGSGRSRSRRAIGQRRAPCLWNAEEPGDSLVAGQRRRGRPCDDTAVARSRCRRRS